MQIADTRSKSDLLSINRTSLSNTSRLTTPAKVMLVILGFYIILKPYYLLPSGSPQIADLLLVLEMAMLLLVPRVKYDAGTQKLLLCMAFFCIYAAFVSVGWAVVLMDKSVAVYATYYAFNLGLMIICLRIGLLHPTTTLRIIGYAIAVSALIQAATAALSPHSSQFRQTASFNNPNQLGYWSLLSLCIFLAVASRIKMKWYLQAPAIICLCYTVAISLSKAAMIAAALMLMLHFIKSPRMIAVALISTTIAYFALENSMIADRVTGRLENIGGQADDSLYSRGYLRIVEYPEYAVPGAGEGALYRFDDKDFSDQRFEIHSTFGTIVFSYGVLGVIAFASAIWLLYRISSIGYMLYLVPPFLYGFTHQGLRFSFLWLLFSVIVILGRTKLKQVPLLRPRTSQQPGRIP